MPHNEWPLSGDPRKKFPTRVHGPAPGGTSCPIRSPKGGGSRAAKPETGTSKDCPLQRLVMRHAEFSTPSRGAFREARRPVRRLGRNRQLARDLQRVRISGYAEPRSADSAPLPASLEVFEGTGFALPGPNATDPRELQRVLLAPAIESPRQTDSGGNRKVSPSALVQAEATGSAGTSRSPGAESRAASRMRAA
jgi:hypothetical protein